MHLLSGTPSVDVIIRARPETYAASFALLETDVVRAAVQLQRLFPR
jgi:hypothetical protein